MYRATLAQFDSQNEAYLKYILFLPNLKTFLQKRKEVHELMKGTKRILTQSFLSDPLTSSSFCFVPLLQEAIHFRQPGATPALAWRPNPCVGSSSDLPCAVTAVPKTLRSGLRH